MMKNIALCLILVFSVSSTSFGAWQDTLDANFDYAESFDGLADWYPSSTVGNTYNTSDMPLKTGGSPSIWTYYSNYTTSTGNAIADHGAINDCRGSGKSLILDYSSTGKGPSRLGFRIGESPSTGYSEVFIFQALRMDKAFYPSRTSTGLPVYYTYFKQSDTLTGFTDWFEWGTPSEWATVYNDVVHQNNISNYGENYFIWDILPNQYTSHHTGELRLLFTPMMRTATEYGAAGNSECYTTSQYAPGFSISLYEDIDVTPYIFTQTGAGEWFYIEQRILLNTPHSSPNGEIEMWLYDNTGSVIGHSEITNVQIMKDVVTADCNITFGHKYNQFVLGGNRLNSDFETAGADKTPASISHYYTDDYIVNSTRIGLDYFLLRSGETPTYDNPTITIQDTNTGTSSSGTITGTYTIDSELSAGICTWSHSGGSVTGFATVLLGVVSGTVTNLPVGTTAVHFSLLDSEGVEATDDPNFIRSAPASSDTTSTAVSHGVVRY